MSSQCPVLTKDPTMLHGKLAPGQTDMKREGLERPQQILIIKIINEKENNLVSSKNKLRKF